MKLIEINRRKLNYLANGLKIKDKDVNEKFEEDYSDLITDKFKSKILNEIFF